MPGGTLHSGCRIVESAGFLFVTMGDGWKSDRSQDLKSLGGKILRVHTDGRIPGDNPFRGSPVWTYGHRNPQGLAFDPKTGVLWSTEHGPDTDDELNVIKPGLNYGWPKCKGERRCMDSNFTPAVKSFFPQETVAISNLLFYRGTAFPNWNGNALFVTLKTGRLYRVRIDGERVLGFEVLIDGQYGRLRDIAEGPDGSIYIAGESEIYRLTPRSLATAETRPRYAYAVPLELSPNEGWTYLAPECEP